MLGRRLRMVRCKGRGLWGPASPPSRRRAVEAGGAFARYSRAMSGALPRLVFFCSAAAPVPQARPAADAARLAREAGAGRPAVLHFWATWCAACEDEFRHLGPLFNALPGRGVAVELVSIDAPETRGRIAPMLERLGVARVALAVLDAPRPAPVARALGEPKWDGTLAATLVV